MATDVVEEIPDHLLRYRETLVAADQKMQEEFDKTVLSLSGGGLGVSLVFLKDVIGTAAILSPRWLAWSWGLWALSSLAILLSYYTAQQTVRFGIRQIDRGEAYTKSFGGWYAKVTAVLNAMGALAFVAGAVCITVFAYANLSVKETWNDRSEVPSSAASAASAPASTSSAAARRDLGRQ